MIKQVQVALAVVLVIMAGVMVWQVLRSQDRSRKEYASC
jgi:preprotein translocase subunit YajC